MSEEHKDFVRFVRWGTTEIVTATLSNRIMVNSPVLKTGHVGSNPTFKLSRFIYIFYFTIEIPTATILLGNSVFLIID